MQEHLPNKHGQELVKVDGTASVRIHLLNHITKLRFGRCEVERSHDSTEFGRVNGSTSVLILMTSTVNKRSMVHTLAFHLLALSKRSNEALYSAICSCDN